MKHTRNDRERVRLLTASETADLLGLSEETVKAWARQGRIPCIRLGSRTLRFDWDQVLAGLADLSGEQGVSR